jgi:GLPGLI family protein
MNSRLILIAFLFFSSLPFAYSQTEFEGKIISSMEVLEAPGEMKGMEAMLGQTITSYYSEHRFRVEQQSKMGKNILLGNEDKKELIMLMDMMGQKIGIMMPMTEEDSPAGGMEFDYNGQSIRMTEDSRVIAGHPCKKGIMGEGEGSLEVWFAEDIRGYPGMKAGLPGMPMEYLVKDAGMIIRITILEINEETVAESLFKIPAEYTLKTQAEMEQFMPLMMGSGPED